MAPFFKQFSSLGQKPMNIILFFSSQTKTSHLKDSDISANSFREDTADKKSNCCKYAIVD